MQEGPSTSTRMSEAGAGGGGLAFGGREEEREATLEQLLYLAFMHKDQPGRSRPVKVAGSRLAFLGEHVVELLLAQFLLLVSPPSPSPFCSCSSRLPAVCQLPASCLAPLQCNAPLLWVW